ncbi:MAG TPA: hypothetical protein DCK83_00435 [Gallionellaceae bacterium]|nr:hypothetical protein [Gallionellaceae bacterium]
MIVLVPNPTFEAPVKLTLPGSKDEGEAKFTFRALNRKRTISLLVLVRAIPRSAARRLVEYIRLCWRIKRMASVVDMLDELVAGWTGIDIPYSKAALRTLLEESPGAPVNILNAWMEHQEAARRKN